MKMSKKLLLFIALMVALNNRVNAISIDYENPNTNYELVIEDDAELLTENQINILKDEMMPLTNYGNIIFKSINENNYYSTSNYASNYYHSNYGKQSGTLFLIDMDNRIIYIFSDGDNYKTITSSKAEIITDNVYRYATRGNYYECASKAYDQINTLLDGGRIAEPMRHISNALIAVVLSFFMSFIYVLFRTKLKKSNNAEIISKSNVSFKVDNVSGKKTGTHRKYSPVSSGTSGGGGSFGGGGGSSGGGGGHSF